MLRLDITPLMLRRAEQIANLAALGRHRITANLRRLALGNAIKHLRQPVLGVLPDLLPAVRVVVVEGLARAERLDEGEVARRAGREDLAAGVDGVLDGEAAGRGTAAVDEEGDVGFARAREGQAQALVEALSDGEDADAESGGFFVGGVLGDFDLRVTFRDAVFREAAILRLDGVDAVREACYAVALLPWLCDFGSDLFNGAGEVAADGCAGRGEEVDVLPVGRVEGDVFGFDEDLQELVSQKPSGVRQGLAELT